MPPPPSTFAGCPILTGPTGSGKSALALELAERIGAEILALDSMTVYRGLDVGTAKPTPADRDRVPHHLIDVLDPWESASVAWYLERAAGLVREVRGRGRVPLFVGGTPFYLKAMICGLFESPPADAELRRRLEAIAPEELHARLRVVDPAAAEKLHAQDVRRVVRALEVHTLTGRPISDWQTEWATAPRPTGPIVCIDRPRTELYERIDRRTERMMAAGWLDEVRRLRALPRPLSREASRAVGYEELSAVLDGKMTEAEATARIQRRTRQFAKRQLTWFRHLPGLMFAAGELTTLLAHFTMTLRPDRGAPAGGPGRPTDTNRPEGQRCGK